jgi:hypothetical protein
VHLEVLNHFSSFWFLWSTRSEKQITYLET